MIALTETGRPRVDRRGLRPLEGRVPSYIQACQMKAWTLTTWRKDEQAVAVRGQKWRHLPYRCKSWRHAGPCARQRAFEDIERIDTAIKARPTDWVYIVLTFDRRAFGGDKTQAFKGISACWGALRKRMARAFGSEGDPIEHVQIIERHRDGWPHVNLLIRNRKLAALCAGGGWKRIRSRWLERNAKACGFGMRTYLDVVRDHDAMSTYIVKLAGEMGKSCQVPLDAPSHFRRLRSSPGLLPSRPKNPEITGKLTRREVEEVEALGLSPLPAFRGVPREVDRSEAGAEDRWYSTLDATEVEPGVIEYAEPYIREVLWVSWSFAPSGGSPEDSGSEPSGACDDAAPPFFDSAMAAAESSALASERQQGFAWDA